MVEGGASQLELKGLEGDRGVPHVVRFDFEKDRTMRNRVWSLEGSDRKLLLDVRNERLQTKRN